MATQTPFYQLKARSKSYYRSSGTAGTHDAVQAPGNFVLYGFPVSLANFSFGFRETQNVSSATLGQIVVPHPSDFTQQFAKVPPSCLLDLKDAEIPRMATHNRSPTWPRNSSPTPSKSRKKTAAHPAATRSPR